MSLVGRVRAGNLAAYSHQELPFERLVEVLNPARSLSRHPLFQVMLVLQNNAELGLELSGLSAGFEAVATASAKFDLSLSLAERRGADGSPAGIEGALEYASDLFDRSSVEAIAGRLVRLLEGAVADPERAIGRLDILGADERHTILREWNATARAVPGATLPELFAAQVARTPEADAVVFEDERLSYGELDARSSQLAHHLRGLGVGPEVVVGLCIERSLAMLVGLLGILKAGGAYLPLDPDYPPERLAFMLADAGAPVLLTRAALRAHLPAHDAHVVCLDADWPAIARQPATAPATNLAPQHPAYVIYTSGSTGTPKGVAVTHQNVVNHMIVRADAGLSDDGHGASCARTLDQLRCFDGTRVACHFLHGATACAMANLRHASARSRPVLRIRSSRHGAILSLDTIPSLHRRDHRDRPPQIFDFSDASSEASEASPSLCHSLRDTIRHGHPLVNPTGRPSTAIDTTSAVAGRP